MTKFSIRAALTLSLLTLGEFSWASLANMANELLENNSGIIRAKSNIQASAYDIDMLKADKNWTFQYTPSYTKNRLESSELPEMGETRARIHNFALNKKFQWGGNLRISESLIQPDAKRRQLPHSYSQSIAYTQDLGANFFGRSFYKQLRISKSKHKISKISSKQSVQSSLLKLSSAYSSARLHKSVLALQIEAHKRAVKRLKLVRRRVKDGLKDKVDLYRTEASSRQQKENVVSAKVRLEKALNELELLLHRKIKGDEIKPYTLSTKEPFITPQGTVDDNTAISIMREQEIMLEESLKKARSDLLPTFKFTAERTTNDMDSVRSETWKRGSLDKDQREIKLSLLLSFPLGKSPQKVRKTKVVQELLTTRIEREKTITNIKYTVDSLRSRIDKFNDNIKSARRRRVYSKKALREINKLYKSGRVSIDGVISVEEALIETEKSIVNYLATRDMTAYALAAGYGALEQYVQQSSKN